MAEADPGVDGWLATRLGRLARLDYGRKIFLLATLPVIVTAAAIAALLNIQSRQFAEREIAGLEAQLIATKKEELRNYLSLARTAIGFIYGNALPDDERAKTEVAQILAAMLYGQDGYVFVYDYDGTNIVAPRQTWLITRNWAGLGDAEGIPVVDRLIAIARQGGGVSQLPLAQALDRGRGADDLLCRRASGLALGGGDGGLSR